MATSTIAPSDKMTKDYIYAGESALDGTAGVVISHPFKNKVTSVTLTVKSTTAPAVTTEAQKYSYSIVGLVVTVYGWTATSSSVTTLIDPTSTDAFSFLMTGY